MLLHIMQVNATGVMPVIFSSSLLAAPAALSRYFPQVLLGSASFASLESCPDWPN
jgi:preprotein translocase subunit SecY